MNRSTEKTKAMRPMVPLTSRSDITPKARAPTTIPSTPPGADAHEVGQDQDGQHDGGGVPGGHPDGHEGDGQPPQGSAQAGFGDADEEDGHGRHEPGDGFEMHGRGG